MRFILRFFGFLFSIGAILFLIGAAVLAYGLLDLLPGPARSRRARQLRAAGDDPRPRRRRQPASPNMPASAGSTCRSRPMPKLVIDAFLSAEDKNFYKHAGHRSRGRRARGRWRTSAPAAGASRAPRPSPSRSPRTSCSTNEQTYERKIREALIALRIEATFSKDKILELYLNEIFLGRLGATSRRRGRGARIISASRSTS